MTKNYFDLVCCIVGDETHLFTAPMCSGLKPGDTVIVEPWNCKSAMHGDIRATVTSVMEIVDNENEYYKFILSVCADMLPLRKIKSKVVYELLRYDDDCDVSGAEVSE